MQFRKISDTKIHCVISQEEMWEKGIEIDDFLDHREKTEEFLREILAEARRANPESMELAFTMGREAYDGGRGDAAAAERLFLEAKALGERSCGGDLSRLGGHDSQIYQFTLGYLRKIAEDRLSGAAGTPSAKSF